MNDGQQKGTESSGLLCGVETRQVIGAAMTVLNILGHGLLEKPYENALCVELKALGIPFVQQPRYPVLYKSVIVGEYVPDLIIFNTIVVDTKTIDRIGNVEKGKMLNYLRLSRLTVGLILNFKHPRLEWSRVILSQTS